MPDKMSQEKISMLRAYGAEVVICPTAVPPDSPESYYSVSDRLAEEIPGGFKPDQYSNMANPEAHYEVTGPEIWEQTGGELDAIVISVGTGGTISGVGRYFKEKKPGRADRRRRSRKAPSTPRRTRATCIRISSRGSARTRGRRRWIPTVVDEWVRVSDRDSFLVARRLAREEGLLVGGSAGTTVSAALEIAKRFGPDATILAMIPDSGRSYLSKFYDDNWMLEHGFVERRVPPPTVSELLRSKRLEETEIPTLVTIAAHQKVGEAIDVMQQYSISQLPVVRDGELEFARRRDRLAAGSRPARPRLQEPGRAARGRRRRDAAAARRGRRATRRSTRCSRRSPAGRTPSSSRARASRSAS